MSEGNEKSKEYVVRGALLHCPCGSHDRRLNLPKCHGTKLTDTKNPLINQKDSKEHVNIMMFGVCSSSKNDNETQVKYTRTEPDGTVQEATGTECCIEVVGNWHNVQEDVIVGDAPAVTLSSYLVCKYTDGDPIRPVTSGQEYEGE